MKRFHDNFRTGLMQSIGWYRKVMGLLLSSFVNKNSCENAGRHRHITAASRNVVDYKARGCQVPSDWPSSSGQAQPSSWIWLAIFDLAYIIYSFRVIYLFILVTVGITLE